MNFEDALKRLAEKEPEKFEWVTENSIWTDCGFSWKTDLTRIKNITQDDIDEILALIGWEYEVGRTWVNLASGKRHVAPHWQFMVWSKPKDYTAFEQEISELGERESFPDKLSAAKAALIAVVEKQYPTEEPRP